MHPRVIRFSAEGCNTESLSRCPTSPEVSDSDDELALAIMVKKEKVEGEGTSLDCPFCEEIAVSPDTLDHHIDTEHITKKPLSFEEWKSLQNAKSNNLHALFERDPKVLTHAQKLVSLLPWRDPSTPTTINADSSITYSLDQWAAFQRLDPVLKLAIDTLKKEKLLQPLEKLSIPFVKNRKLDKNGIPKYKYFHRHERDPRLLTVVPHILQNLILSYFHKNMGCETKF